MQKASSLPGAQPSDPSREGFIERRKAAPTKLPPFENMARAAEVRQTRARPLEIENVLLSRQQRGNDASD